MRLIDADNLEAISFTTPGEMDAESYFAGVDFILNEIDELPTIESNFTKQGRWQKGERPFGYLGDTWLTMECSECGLESIYHKKLPNYCPECGCKMTNGGEKWE